LADTTCISNTHRKYFIAFRLTLYRQWALSPSISEGNHCARGTTTTTTTIRGPLQVDTWVSRSLAEPNLHKEAVDDCMPEAPTLLNAVKAF